MSLPFLFYSFVRFPGTLFCVYHTCRFTPPPPLIVPFYYLPGHLCLYHYLPPYRYTTIQFTHLHTPPAWDGWGAIPVLPPSILPPHTYTHPSPFLVYYLDKFYYQDVCTVCDYLPVLPGTCLLYHLPTIIRSFHSYLLCRHYHTPTTFGIPRFLLFVMPTSPAVLTWTTHTPTTTTTILLPLLLPSSFLIYATYHRCFYCLLPAAEPVLPDFHWVWTGLYLRHHACLPHALVLFYTTAAFLVLHTVPFFLGFLLYGWICHLRTSCSYQHTLLLLRTFMRGLHTTPVLPVDRHHALRLPGGPITCLCSGFCGSPAYWRLPGRHLPYPLHAWHFTLFPCRHPLLRMLFTVTCCHVPATRSLFHTTVLLLQQNV